MRDLTPNQYRVFCAFKVVRTGFIGDCGVVSGRQRKARTRVFSIEDEVREKRRQLMDELDRRVAQNSTFETIYRIAWTVE